MTRVWEHASVKGSALLLLLAIADHAHDDGTGAWPSQKTLATKTRLSVRQVRRLLEQLEARGELRVVERDGRTALLTVLAGADKMSEPPSPDVRGGADTVTSGGSDISARTQDTARSDEPRTVPQSLNQSSRGAAFSRTGLRPLRAIGPRCECREYALEHAGGIGHCVRPGCSCEAYRVASAQREIVGATA